MGHCIDSSRYVGGGGRWWWGPGVLLGTHDLPAAGGMDFRAFDQSIRNSVLTGFAEATQGCHLPLQTASSHCHTDIRLAKLNCHVSLPSLSADHLSLHPGEAVLKAVALRLAAFDLVELAMFVRKLDQATGGSGGGGGVKGSRGGSSSRGTTASRNVIPSEAAMTAQQDGTGATTVAPAAESWLLGLKRTAKRQFAAKA